MRCLQNETFGLDAPDLTRLYISSSEITTNPVGIAFFSLLLAPMAVIFVVKEYRLKDRVAAYLINASVTICMLVWLALACMAALLPLLPPKIVPEL